MAELFRVKLTLHTPPNCTEKFWTIGRKRWIMFSHKAVLHNMDGIPEDCEHLDLVIHDRPGKNRFEAEIIGIHDIAFLALPCFADFNLVWNRIKIWGPSVVWRTARRAGLKKGDRFHVSVEWW